MSSKKASRRKFWALLFAIAATGIGYLYYQNSSIASETLTLESPSEKRRRSRFQMIRANQTNNTVMLRTAGQTTSKPLDLVAGNHHYIPYNDSTEGKIEHFTSNTNNNNNNNNKNNNGSVAQIGYSTALSRDGQWFATSSIHENAVYVFTWSLEHNDWIPFDRLQAHDATDHSAFGSSLALNNDGSVLVIGGSGDNQGFGATWVFVRHANHDNSQVYVQQGNKKIGHQGTVGNPLQGQCVSVDGSGTLFAVGGPLNNHGQGAVWIFEQVSGTSNWQELGSGPLIASDLSNSANQGWSIALTESANHLVVGAPQENNGLGAGLVYQLNHNTGNYERFANILSGSATGHRQAQGISVGLSNDGSRIAIFGPNSKRSGALLWIYSLIQSTQNQYIQEAKLAVSNYEPNAGAIHCPHSLAMSGAGDLVAVGHPTHNQHQGQVVVFQRTTNNNGNNNSWTVAQTIVATTDNNNNSGQGYAVCFDEHGQILGFSGIHDQNHQGANWIYVLRDDLHTLRSNN